MELPVTLESDKHVFLPSLCKPSYYSARLTTGISFMLPNMSIQTNI